MFTDLAYGALCLNKESRPGKTRCRSGCMYTNLDNASSTDKPKIEFLKMSVCMGWSVNPTQTMHTYGVFTVSRID